MIDFLFSIASRVFLIVAYSDTFCARLGLGIMNDSTRVVYVVDSGSIAMILFNYFVTINDYFLSFLYGLSGFLSVSMLLRIDMICLPIASLTSFFLISGLANMFNLPSVTYSTF